MERLTKDLRSICIVEEKNKNHINKIHDKLSKLENIEEELGISLEVLFKALKEGIWYENKFIPATYISFNYEYKFLRICFIYQGFPVYGYAKLEDYGKTWWLEKSKEESNEKEII